MSKTRAQFQDFDISSCNLSRSDDSMLAAHDSEDVCSIRISEWKVKKSDVKKKMSKLERKETEIVKLYDDIMTAVYVRLGFFIAFVNYFGGLYAKPYATYWMYTVMAIVTLGFIFEVIYPIYSAWTHMRGLEDVIQKLVIQREKIHESCMILLDDYDSICLSASTTKNYNDPLFKELREHELNKLEDFKKEDKVPKARKKFSRKFPLAIGVSCMIYSITLLLFTFYKSHGQLVLPSAPPSPHGPPTGHTLSETIEGDLESSHWIPQVEATGSKILYVNNLALSVTHADVESFFKRAGKIANVGFALDRDGLFSGFGHVEFATVEAIQNALKLHGQEFFGRRISLTLAQEMSVRTPCTPSTESLKSYHKGQRSRGIVVRGFDTSVGEEHVQSALEEHFGSCGDISRLSFPRDHKGSLKGFAYMEFTDGYGLSKALQLDGSELGGGILMVTKANPRDDSFDCCGGSVRDHGRSVGETRLSGGGCGVSGGSGGCIGKFGHLAV